MRSLFGGIKSKRMAAISFFVQKPVFITDGNHVIFGPKIRPMKYPFFKSFLVLLFFTTQLSRPDAQTVIDWNLLADVKFNQKYADELGITYDEAVFGKWVMPFDGKEVRITGFMIPLDGMGFSWVLSRNPNSSCFFCGGAGPETVIELRLKPSAIKKYKLDERRTFKGILKLNRENMDHLTYMLMEAEPVGE